MSDFEYNPFKVEPGKGLGCVLHEVTYEAQLKREAAHPDTRITFAGAAYGDRQTGYAAQVVLLMIPPHVHGCPIKQDVVEVDDENKNIENDN
ncbi:MAG: hypothetical protein LBP87_06675 [Planctomycetaceae bacterium]|nr:hypothetical protein [Planctomycetaceae bacterium]